MSLIAAPAGCPPAVLYDIDWPTYTRLLRVFEGRHLRLTYDRGTLEIMSPLWEHEGPAGSFGERLPSSAGRPRRLTWGRPVSSGGWSGSVLSLGRVISTALLLASACAFPTVVLAASQPGLGPGGPLPLAFEPNQGQADPTVKFLARGPGYGLFFAPGETVLVLTPPQAGGTGRRPGASLTSRTPSVVRMRLIAPRKSEIWVPGSLSTRPDLL